MASLRKTTELLRRKADRRSPELIKGGPAGEPGPTVALGESPRTSTEGLQKYFLKPQPCSNSGPRKPPQSYMLNLCQTIDVKVESVLGHATATVLLDQNSHTRDLEAQNLRVIESNLRLVEEKYALIELLRKHANGAKQSLQNYQISRTIEEVSQILRILEGSPATDGSSHSTGKTKQEECQTSAKILFLQQTLQELKAAIMSSEGVVENTKAIIKQNSILSAQQLAEDLRELSEVLNQRIEEQSKCADLEERIGEYHTRLHAKTEENEKLKEKFEVLRNYQKNLEEEIDNLKKHMEQPQTKDCFTETSFEQEVAQPVAAKSANSSRSLTGSKGSKSSKVGPIILGRAPTTPRQAPQEDDMRAFLLIQAFSIEQLIAHPEISFQTN